MPKRRRLQDDEGADCIRRKRSRLGHKHGLSDMSDELVVRIVSFLSVADLLRIER
jgi:hypothetical protein